MKPIVIALLLYLWIQPLMAQDTGSLFTGFRMLNIPGWDGMVKQDPFTDEWVTGFAMPRLVMT